MVCVEACGPVSAIVGFAGQHWQEVLGGLIGSGVAWGVIWVVGRTSRIERGLRFHRRYHPGQSCLRFALLISELHARYPHIFRDPQDARRE